MVDKKVMSKEEFDDLVDIQINCPPFSVGSGCKRTCVEHWSEYLKPYITVEGE